jgi:hypothetical protein
MQLTCNVKTSVSFSLRYPIPKVFEGLYHNDEKSKTRVDAQ